jgi:hypothetical protein
MAAFREGRTKAVDCAIPASGRGRVGFLRHALLVKTWGIIVQ